MSGNNVESKRVIAEGSSPAEQDAIAIANWVARRSPTRMCSRNHYSLRCYIVFFN
jgi:hypothetical protein